MFVRRQMFRFAAVLTVTVVGACSTALEVEHLESNKARDKPIEGVVYYLPTGLVDTTVTRRITSCRTKQSDPIAQFKMTAEVTVRYVPDLAEPLLIDYEELNSPLKQSKVELAFYENNTLKSVNADLRDRSRAILANVGRAAVQVAKTIFRPADVPESIPLTDLQDPCVPETKVALIKVALLRNQIAEKQREYLNSGVDRRPAVEAAIAELKQQLLTFEQQLTHREQYLGIEPLFDAAGEWHTLLPPELGVFQKFFKPSVVQTAAMELTDGTTVRLQAQSFQAALRATPDVAHGKTRGALVYRQPGPVTLQLCKGDNCSNAENVMSRAEHLLPQAGFRAVLPLRNGAFDENVLTASFSPSGGLEKFSYSTEAQLEAASGALADAAATAQEIVAVERNDELVGLQRAVQKKKLENELLLLQQEQEKILTNDAQ